MKRIVISVLLLSLLTSVDALAARQAVADGIDRYVTVKASPVRLSEPTYSLDGTATLELSGDKRIVSRSIATGEVTETIFDVDNARETKIANIDGFILSPDGKNILVWRDTKKIYRHSFTAEYYVYEIRSRLLRPLSDNHQRQRSPLFSPDGRMVAFVAEDNNIYLRKFDYNSEVAVTTDGKVNSIINGVPDWTYEEEFATTCSMTWSPDNLVLCYIKYNETDVPIYDFTLYEGACDGNPEYALYPGSFSYKYPVAGKPNSIVSVNSYDIETRATKTLTLADDVEYVPRIEYAYSPERLMVVTLNRAQNRMELFAVNPKSLVARSVLVETSPAWVQPQVYEDITFAPEWFVTFSARTGYNHLYQYSYNGQMQRQLTQGNYDATAYYGYDAKSARHFYQAASSSPINRVVSCIDSKGIVKNLTPDEGYGAMWLSPTGAYYTLSYNSVKTPPCYTLYQSAGDKKIRTLEDNKAYGEMHAGEPCREFFTFTTEEGVSLNGMILKPKDMDSSRKYPVIMYQYSGPGSQEVLNRWSLDWENYFAAQGFIIVSVDGRGTGGRGRDFEYSVYRDLGHLETVDQAAAAEYVASLPFVDKDRIGIWGWSYGGYETLMCVSRGEFPFACGVAVAPVTDWKYYDTVYAERYMLTPKENAEGYTDSAPINYVDKVHCPLLMIHGTADDNVHLANTMEYVSALEISGGYCDMLLFPNMNHSIYGCNSRMVIYSRILDYFRQYLKNEKR